jgi:hypothetical protein
MARPTSVQARPELGDLYQSRAWCRDLELSSLIVRFFRARVCAERAIKLEAVTL